jgi:general secretion pathway protein L
VTSTLCLFFGQQELDEDSEVGWTLIQAGGSHVERCRLGEVRDKLKSRNGDLRTFAVCPGDAIMTTSVKIPSRQAATLRKALPYVLEESIATPLEHTHLATAPLGPGDEVHVAVVAHDRMIHWIDSLHASGLAPEALLPDYLLVPRRGPAIAVMVGASRSLIRTGEYAGLSVSNDVLEATLNVVMAEAGENLAGLEFQSCAGPDNAAELATGMCAEFASRLSVPVEHIEYREPLREVLANEVVRRGESVINLCQGGYSIKLRRRGERRNYQPLAIGLAASLVLYLGATLGSAWYMNQRADELRRDAESLYRDIFPDERRLSNLQRRMQTHIERAGGAVDAPFLPLFGEVSQALQVEVDAPPELQSVRYDAGRSTLNIELVAADRVVLDRLQTRLSASGLTPSLVSDNERDGAVVREIEVRGS